MGGLARLIPAPDRASDFAVLPPLLIKQQEHAHAPLPRGGSHRAHQAKRSVMSTSFLLWFLAATIVPLLVLQALPWQDRLMAMADAFERWGVVVGM